MKHALRGVALAAGLVLGTAAAHAEAWPTRPVTMVVPFTAGTTSDVLGRALAEHLGRKLGQPVVIENRGGAGGNIAAGAVAKAQPDGYTILLATTGQAATNKLMYRQISFDPQQDFAPVALVGKSPVVVVAGLESPAKSLKEAIDYAKDNPEKLTVGYPGNGTLGHITGVLLLQRTGIKMKQVQYRGTTQIITDIMGGHIDIAMDSMGGYVPNILEGNIKALAVAGHTRWPSLPDVPTVAEVGLPGFEASVWYALLAPAGTPPDIIARLNAGTNEFLDTPEGKAMFAKLNIEGAGGTPEDLKAFIDAEIQKWAPIIKSADIKF
ncbi:Bug family tripartite tricarboxylate transporter substrate binding protein [Microvirga sp. TS319]|uniref:Bug family tripartite tricarboxylate transporter substrate binding protein n=1 Tax=Microvirga sp. TS319 TaxID=3241165 RepID=UPI00351A9BB2